MKPIFALLTLAVLLVSTGTTSPAFCKGEKQACYRSCVDCRTRCKNETCQQTCYQIKRSCCSSNGYGGGPHKDCPCT
jgi:hypothetical protein